MDKPDENVKPFALHLADRFFAAIESNDMETVRAIYASDALIWHNFDPLEARQDRRLSQSVEDNLALLAALPQLIPNMKYNIWHELATTGGFVRQHVISGMTKVGEPIAIPVCVVVDISGERITALYEYLDIRHLPSAVIEYFSQTH
jgi:uncharacterized protein